MAIKTRLETVSEVLLPLDSEDELFTFIIQKRLVDKLQNEYTKSPPRVVAEATHTGFPIRRIRRPHDGFCVPYTTFFHRAGEYSPG